MPQVKIGENIKSVRKALNLTQTEFASRLNISERSIRAYEQGKIPIDSNFVLKLINIFSVNPSFLFLNKSGMFYDERKECAQECIDILKDKYGIVNKEIEDILNEILNSESVKDAVSDIILASKGNKESINNLKNLVKGLELAYCKR